MDKYADSPSAPETERVNTRTLVAVSLVALLLSGISIGWGIGTSAGSSGKITVTVNGQQGNESNSKTPFKVTLVETMENFWNSTSESQPAFFLLGDHGLQSSSNISLPAQRLIELTIVSYDTPTENTTAAEGLVQRTVDGNLMLVNGTLAAGASNDAVWTMEHWGHNVTSVPAQVIAHTITIQSLGINIPVVGGATEIVYLYFDHPGTYTWICLTVCGLGNDGMLGAMVKPGWMMGTFSVE